MAKCKAITKSGATCKAQAQTGRDFCFVHDPAKTEEIKTAQSRGGSSLKVIDRGEYKPWRGTAGEVTVMNTPRPQEIVNLLANTIDEVKTGEIDPKVANAVGYLAGIIVKVMELEALDERLSAIEEAVGVKR